MKKKYWLLDYFIHDKKDLAPSYVKKVERFLNERKINDLECTIKTRKTG